MRMVYEMSTNDMVKLIETALDNQVDCSNAKVGGTGTQQTIENIIDKQTGKTLSFNFNYEMNEDDFVSNVKNHFLLNH